MNMRTGHIPSWSSPALCNRDNQQVQDNEVFWFGIEKAIRTKKKRSRGALVNQMEKLYVLLPEQQALSFKKRKHFAGTTHGDVIGPIMAPAWDESWVQMVLMMMIATMLMVMVTMMLMAMVMMKMTMMMMVVMSEDYEDNDDDGEIYFHQHRNHPHHHNNHRRLW